MQVEVVDQTWSVQDLLGFRRDLPRLGRVRSLWLSSRVQNFEAVGVSFVWSWSFVVEGQNPRLAIGIGLKNKA